MKNLFTLLLFSCSFFANAGDGPSTSSMEKLRAVKNDWQTAETKKAINTIVSYFAEKPVEDYARTIEDSPSWSYCLSGYYRVNDALSVGVPFGIGRSSACQKGSVDFIDAVAKADFFQKVQNYHKAVESLEDLSDRTAQTLIEFEAEYNNAEKQNLKLLMDKQEQKNIEQYPSYTVVYLGLLRDVFSAGLKRGFSTEAAIALKRKHSVKSSVSSSADATHAMDLVAQYSAESSSLSMEQRKALLMSLNLNPLLVTASLNYFVFLENNRGGFICDPVKAIGYINELAFIEE